VSSVAWQVVIAGGGFGGFYAARALERVLPVQSARVTLVNDANFMLYTPLLPGAAGATLDPRHVVVSLRSQLRRTELVIGRVTGADPARASLGVQRSDGEQLELPYDQLIVALGSVSRTLPIPGLAEHAIGFKSLPDATALRNQVLNCLDIAESVEDPAMRAAHLGFVFVGAGYAGVEGLAELQDFAAQAIELYPRCRAQGMRWVLIEARDRIMQEVPASLSAFAEHELRGRGIEVRTGTTLRELSARDVTLADGEQIATRTVVWTAGVKPSPIVARLGLPLDREGRIVVDRTMRVELSALAATRPDDGVHGAARVWAIGDCAAVPDPARPGQPCPPTAQHAIRQGRLVARNVAASFAGTRLRAFRYRTKGVVAELGNREAVALTLGIRWRGMPAWLIARTYHLLLMPGIGRRLRLLVDWNVALVFGRDVSAPGRLGSPTPLEHD
jgi:NADH:ubiquinone reductase (H+-translocating)